MNPNGRNRFTYCVTCLIQEIALAVVDLEAYDDSESACCRRENSLQENAAIDAILDRAAANIMRSVLVLDTTRRRRRRGITLSWILFMQHYTLFNNNRTIA